MHAQTRNLPHGFYLLIAVAVLFVAGGCMNNGGVSSTSISNECVCTSPDDLAGAESPHDQPVSRGGRNTCNNLAESTTAYNFANESTSHGMIGTDLPDQHPLFASSASAAVDTASKNYSIALEGLYLYGPIRGSVQTPSGGEPGSTSPKRPRLSEIGINDAGIIDASLTVSSGDHGLFLGAQFIQLSGSGTLQESLVSQGKSFAIGTRVDSNVSLNWYRAGYQYRWVVSEGQGNQPELTLFPAIGGALFTFDYKLKEADSTSGSPRVSRSYSKALPQVGLTAEWRPRGGPLSLSVGALGFPAIGSLTPEIATESLLVKYQFVHQPKIEVEGIIGVQFEQFYYIDHQRVSNRIQADLGPLFVLGFRVDF